jgi:ABC-type Fe3+-hydroxamate transport system substrate-binding protein
VRVISLLASATEIVCALGAGEPLSIAQRELSVLERHPWWPDLQAVRKGNVTFADGNLFFNRSGITIARTAEIITEMLHGVSFDASIEAMQAVWA